MATVHQAEVLIIGGGIAGLSTARHLARGGQGGVVLLDREELPGFYASGHNAGIARQLTGVAEHTALTVEGCARLHAAGLVDGRGGILLGLEQGGTEALAAEAAAFGLPFARLAGSPYPELLAEEQLRVPSDGEIDTDGLLRFFLLEKAFYEIEYELAHRPDWLRVALNGAVRVLVEGVAA